MTTFGYVRVSTDAQNTVMQVDALRAAGVRLEDIQEDHAVSGSTAAKSRAGIQALLARMRPGDTLACYSVSRLGRSTRDLLATLHDLQAAGVRFRSLTEPFDSEHYVGKFMFTILAAVAEMERDMTRERTRANVASRRARGARIGRPKGTTRATPAQIEAFAASRASGAPVAEAARFAGISRAQARRLISG